VNSIKEKTDPSNQARAPERRRLIKALGVTGSAATIACWHKPIIDTIVLPAHAQTSEPVVLTSTEAVADTSGGLFVRAALSGPAKTNQRVKMEVLTASEPRDYETVVEKVIKTDESGVAEANLSSLRLKMLAGDRYLVKLAPESLASAKVTTLKGQIKAAPDFALEVKTLEVAASAVKVEIKLSEAVRKEEVVAMNMVVANEKGAIVASKAFKVAAVAERTSAIAALNISDRDMAAAGIKLAAGNKVTVSASMARKAVFGTATASLSKTLAKAVKETTVTTESTGRPTTTTTTTESTSRPTTSTITTTESTSRPTTTTSTTIKYNLASGYDHDDYHSKRRKINTFLWFKDANAREIIPTR